MISEKTAFGVIHKNLAGDTTDTKKGKKARLKQRESAEKAGASLPQSTNIKSQKKLISF